MSCRLQRSQVRERGRFGFDRADQVVQRSFGCHPERGSDEPGVEAVCEFSESRLAEHARGDAGGVEYV